MLMLALTWFIRPAESVREDVSRWVRRFQSATGHSRVLSSRVLVLLPPLPSAVPVGVLRPFSRLPLDGLHQLGAEGRPPPSAASVAASGDQSESSSSEARAPSSPRAMRCSCFWCLLLVQGDDDAAAQRRRLSVRAPGDSCCCPRVSTASVWTLVPSLAG